MNAKDDTMEKIVSLSKRRGFIYQGSEIYGGLAGTWDYGPLGVALKKNIENLWWKQFVESRDDMYGIDSAILMNQKVWEASGHTGAGFTDPLVECQKCRRRFRADHLDNKEICPICGGHLGEEQKFNLMFKTFVGPTSHDAYEPEEPEVGSDEEGRPIIEGVTPERHLIEYDPDSISYLRPETAQGMFVNFKNIIDSFHPKLPFGIAQIGRVFRNEIAPRDFIFRVRELEIMEFEYFLEEKDWQKQFEYWKSHTHEWFRGLGFDPDDIKEIEIPDGERAHYSKRTIDFHFKYPHKFDEIGGLAYRTDFDLKNHIEHSGVDLSYVGEGGERFVPHVIEPTFGLGRHVLAVIAKAYTEDELGGEKRVLLRLRPSLAPIKAAVFPLLKNKPQLVEKARGVYTSLKKEVPQIMWDDNGNIGKRYRRQDEIGTPFCVTVDFQTLDDNSVTLRDRDSGEQVRVSEGELLAHLKSKVVS